MKYDFTSIMNRHGKDAIAVDSVGQMNGFAPEAPISRQDLATLLFRYMEQQGVDVTVSDGFAFADEEQIAEYARQAMYALHQLGVVQGVDGDNAAPQANATRAQTAAMLHRLLNALGTEA